jgi:hypothetical protein
MPRPATDRIEVRPPAESRVDGSRAGARDLKGDRGRARPPQLHIGSIDVTVVPPAAPDPPSPTPPPIRRPLARPAQPAPWFGLAQR